MARRKQKQRQKQKSSKRVAPNRAESNSLNAQLSYQKLEPRRVLTPTISLAGAVLQIEMEANNDFATVNFDKGTSEFVVFDGTTTFKFADGDVKAISVFEDGSGPFTNNSVSFFDQFTLEGDGTTSLSITGVENVLFGKGALTGDFTFSKDVTIQDATSISDDTGQAKIQADQDFEIKAAGVDVSFTNSGNDFTTISLIANKATVVDSDSIVLESSTLTSDLSIKAGDDITDAEDAVIGVSGKGTFIAEGTITLADDTANDGTDSLTIDGVATFQASDGVADANNPIAIGGNKATADFGSLNFTSDANVTIVENSKMDLTGTSSADSVQLTAKTSISEAAGTDILNVDDGAKFTLSNGTGSISLLSNNNLGGTVEVSGVTDDLRLTNINAGAAIPVGTPTTLDNLELRFTNSATSINLTDFTINNDLIVEAGDSITDSGKVKVSNNATLIAGKSITLTDAGAEEFLVTNAAVLSATKSISVSNIGTFSAGSINFNSGGDVIIREDSATSIAGINTAKTLTLESTDSISNEANSKINVTESAFFKAANDIDLGNAAGDQVNFGSVGFSGAEVKLSEDSETHLDGISATKLDVVTGKLITQSGVDTGAGTGAIEVTGDAEFTLSSGKGSIVLSKSSIAPLVNTNDGTFQDNILDGSVTITGVDTDLRIRNTSVNADAADLIGAGLTLKNLEIRHTQADINLPGKQLTISEELILEAGELGTSANSITDTNATKIFANSATIIASDDITLAQVNNNTLQITKDFAVSAGDDITIGKPGSPNVVNFGRLNFNAGLDGNGNGDVNITEDGNMDLFGSNQADGLTLDADVNGNIEDSANTQLVVTNDAKFDATFFIKLNNDSKDVLSVGGTSTFIAPNGIEVGGAGKFESGSITFDSKVGQATIQQDSDMVIAGANIAKSLDVSSTGSISDAADTQITIDDDAAFQAETQINLNNDSKDILAVGGNAKFVASDGDNGNGNNAISVGVDGKFTSGTITFDSADAVTIQQDAATKISGQNKAGSLSLTTDGKISNLDNSEIEITNAAFFNSTDDISLGNAVADKVNFGSVGFVGKNIDVVEDSTMHLDGTKVDALKLTATNLITQSGNNTGAGTTAIEASDDVTLTLSDGNGSVVLSKSSIAPLVKTNDGVFQDNIFAKSITVNGVDSDLRIRNISTSADINDLVTADVTLKNLEIRHTDAAIETPGFKYTISEDLILEAGKSLTDANNAFFDVEGNATLIAGETLTFNDDVSNTLDVNGNTTFIANKSITIGGDGKFVTGTLTFSSPEDVTIQEDDDSVITGVNQAKTLILESTKSITDDDTTATKINVDGDATFNAGTTILLNNKAGDSLVVDADAAFTAPDGITIGKDGNFQAGTINFNSANGTVDIQEDDDTVIKGVNQAKTLILESTKSITDDDAAATKINVDANATFTAGTNILLNNKAGDSLVVDFDAAFTAPDGITIGEDGNFLAGTINFNSANGTVDIQEDDDTVIKGVNQAKTLILQTAKSITDDDAAATKINVDGDATFNAGTTILLNNKAGDSLVVDADAAFTAPDGITIGKDGNFQAGTINFNSTNGTVNIQEDDDTVIKGVNQAKTLILESTKSITDDDAAATKINVDANATFTAGTNILLNNKAGDSLIVDVDAAFTAPDGITIGEDGNFQAGTINFNSTNGTVNIQEDDDIVIKGNNQAKTLILQTAKSITDDDAAATKINVDGDATFNAGTTILLNNKAGDSLVVDADAAFTAPDGITIGKDGNFQAGTINFNSTNGTVKIQEDDDTVIKGVNQAKTLILESTKSITDDDAAATKINVDANATFTAGTTILLNNKAGDSLVVDADAAFTAPDGITIGKDGNFQAGTINFNSANGTVDIQEDDDTVIKGVNQAKTLILESTKSITDDDAAATKINVDANATFTAGTNILLNNKAGDSLVVDFDAAFTAPDGITIGEDGNFLAGTINFNSANGTVDIQEDDDIVIKGNNQAKTLILQTAKSITDDDAAATKINVDGDATFNAGTTILLNNKAGDSLVVDADAAFTAPDGITIGKDGNFQAGTINFNSTNGTVNIQEDDDTVIKGVNQAKTLILESTKSITDDDAAATKINVDANATFTAGTNILLNNKAGDSLVVDADAAFTAPDGITIGEDGNFQAGTINFNSTNGTVDIQEDDDTVIKGVNQAKTLILESTKSITDDDAAATKINVDANATFTAGTNILLNNKAGDSLVVDADAAFTAPDGITIGEDGNFQAGTINFNSTNGTVDIQEDDDTAIKGVNQAKTLILESTKSITDDDAAATKINVDANATFTAGTNILLNNKAGDSLVVDADAAFTAPDGITVGEDGNFQAGTINFNSATGTVNIQEDDDTIIKGNNQAQTLILESTKSIIDDDVAGTKINVDTNATLNAGTTILLNNNAGDQLNVKADASFTAPNGITVGENGTFLAGTINFNSSNGTVNIQEDNETVIKGVNQAKTLIIESTKSITDDDTAATKINVDGNATFEAGTTILLNNKAGDSLVVDVDAAFAAPNGITVGEAGNFQAGTINFNSANGTVNIQEDNDTVIKGVNQAKTLILESTKSITDDDSAATKVSVATNATFNAGTTITLNDNSNDLLSVNNNTTLNAPNSIRIGENGTFNSGTINFTSTNGNVRIQEDSSTVIQGVNQAQSLQLSSTDSITDAAGTQVTINGNASFNAATTIKLNDSAGDGLQIGSNALFVSNGSLEVGGVNGKANFGSLTFRSANGNATIQEDSSTLLSGVSNANQLTLNSTGSITDNNGATLTVTPGNATLVAGDAIDLNAQKTNAINIGSNFNLTAQNDIKIGTAGNANFGTLTFESKTGSVTVFEDSTTAIAGTNSAKSFELNSAGSITDVGNATIQATAGDGTFNAATNIALNDSNNVISIQGHADFNAQTGIVVAEAGDARFGSVRFNTAGGQAVIFEDDSTQLLGQNTADSLVLNSSGNITDQAGTKIDINDPAGKVAGDALIRATGNINLGDSAGDRLAVEGQLTVVAPQGITLGEPGLNRFGSLNFNSSKGAVEIHEDGDTELVGSNTANQLQLNSRFRNNSDDGSIRSADNTQIVVDSGNANFQADGLIRLANGAAAKLDVSGNGKFTAGGDITVEEAGESNFGSLTFQTNTGNVEIQEDSATLLIGANEARQLTLRSNGNLTQSATSSIDVSQGNTDASSNSIAVGLTTLKAGVNGDRAIVLDANNNDFNRLEIEGASDATIVETNDLIFHNILVDANKGTLDVTAGNGVTQINNGANAKSIVTAQNARFEVGFAHLGATDFETLDVDRSNQSDDLVDGLGPNGLKRFDRGVRFNASALTSRNAGNVSLQLDPGVDVADINGPGIADEANGYTFVIQNNGNLEVSRLETTGGNVYIETVGGGDLTFTETTAVSGPNSQLNVIAGGTLGITMGTEFLADNGLVKGVSVPDLALRNPNLQSFSTVDPTTGIQTVRLLIGEAGEQFFQVRITYADGAVQEFPGSAFSLVGGLTSDFVRQTSGVNSLGVANEAYNRAFLLQNPVLTSLAEVINDSRINLFEDGGATDLNVNSLQFESQLARGNFFITSAAVETPKIYVPEPPNDQLADPVQGDSELVEFDDIRPFVTADLKELFSVRLMGNSQVDKQVWGDYEPSEVDEIVEEILSNPTWRAGKYQILRTTVDGATEVLREFQKELQEDFNETEVPPGEASSPSNASIQSPNNAAELAAQQELRDVEAWVKYLWERKSSQNDEVVAPPSNELGLPQVPVSTAVEESPVSVGDITTQGPSKSSETPTEQEPSQVQDGRFKEFASRVGVATTVGGAIAMARLAKSRKSQNGHTVDISSDATSQDDNPFSKQSRRKRKRGC